jgi:hypothetical protein
MNPTDPHPLAALKDIHLPPVPGWWPPAPGWWMLAVMLLAVGGYAVHVWRRRRLSRQPVKLAMEELSRLDLQSKDPHVQARVLQELSALLRRFCLVFFPRQQVAGLCGEAWLAFLREKAAEKGLTITDAELSPLLEKAYAPIADVDLEALGNLVAKWLAAQKRKTRRRS